ncbi:hypothetical protein BGZ70_007826 [Mortierella alpina]|uniref:Uncharacterized protein n=1 Tax=Mortierella alpina TaxID=64518 RepID=A0A9P6M2F8_MORAP|nr:hypothetical protein BGZ70_007826 [Mortierella alpina]
MRRDSSAQPVDKYSGQSATLGNQLMEELPRLEGRVVVKRMQKDDQSGKEFDLTRSPTALSIEESMSTESFIYDGVLDALDVLSLRMDTDVNTTHFQNLADGY